MRDRAIDGLTNLAFRQHWRSSEHGDVLVTRVRQAITDDNPVVRMTATQAFRVVYADLESTERVRLVGELLRQEADPNVRKVLLGALHAEAYESPEQVDGLVRDLTSENKELRDAGRKTETFETPVETLTFLAIEHQTRFATQSVRTWAETAPQSEEVGRAIQFVRGYLAPGAEPTVQDRAFRMVSTAAAVCLARWSTGQHPQESEPSGAEIAELKHALEVLNGIANQLYFASGALEDKRGGVARGLGAAHERFAALAVPVLIVCARSKASPIVHHVVETLLFLAPIDNKRALLSMAEAIASDGAYIYDSMSSDLVMPYLKMLLAEHRELVLFDEGGVAAFRTLLSAFASGGNESALELAFTFSDVFR